MNSYTTRRFRRLFAQLPGAVQRQAREAYRRFCREPFHPSLRFRRVHAARAIYSVRISLAYRALGIQERDEIVWFWIGSHADYDKMLAQQ